MRLHSITFAVLLLGSVTMTHAGTVTDGLQAYNTGDYHLAFSIWQPLAENGDPEAQFYLAHLYQTGAGIDPCSAAALKWYYKAAAQGHLTAQYRMNMMMDMIEARYGRPAQPKL